MITVDRRRTPAPWDEPDEHARATMTPLFKRLGYDGPGAWTPGTPQRLAFEYFVGRELQSIAIARFSQPKPMGLPPPIPSPQH